MPYAPTRAAIAPTATNVPRSAPIAWPHHISGKAARNRDYACHKKELHTRTCREGRHKEQHDEAKDLHGVDARLANGLCTHDSGHKGKRHNHKADEGRETEHKTKHKRRGSNHEGEQAAIARENGPRRGSFATGSPELARRRHRRLRLVRNLRKTLAGALPHRDARPSSPKKRQCDVLDDNARARTHHEPHAEARHDALRRGDIPKSEHAARPNDAKPSGNRTDRPPDNRAPARKKTYSPAHGRQLQTCRHTRNGNLSHERGDDTEDVARHAPGTRCRHRAKEHAACLPASPTCQQRLCRRTTDGVLQIGLIHKMSANEGRAHETEKRTGKGNRKHLEHAHVIPRAQNPHAGNGEGKAARNHGAGGHNDLRDIRFVKARAARSAQQYKRSYGGEDRRPGKRAHLKGGVDRRGGDDDAAHAPDQNADRRELPAQWRAASVRTHRLSLRISAPPLPGSRVTAKSVQYSGVRNARCRTRRVS